MPDARGLRRFVPPSLRERVFDPAVADAARERRIRRRRARSRLARAGVELLFLFRALAAARECRAMARDARQPFDTTRGRTPMIKQDLVFALRMLRKAPGFTLAAVLATALGIGANTAIFTVVKQVLLQPLPYPEPGRIVDVNEYSRGRASAVSPPNFMDWRDGNQTLAALSVYTEEVLTFSGGAEPSRVSAGFIDERLTAVMGVQPLLGRAFTDEDTRPGGRKVVILGHEIWRRVYGGDRAIVSRDVILEGAPHEVVGVMPRGYDFPDTSELWLPLRLDAHDRSPSQRGAHYVAAVGRLKPGVSASQATADLDRIEQALAKQHPDKLEG